MESIWEFLSSIDWYWYLIFLIIIVFLYDVFQRRHIILRNFPVVGHFRYWLESIGPELRQYIVANNREELPFNRIERGWIYASAKNENNYEGFGTDRDIYANQYIFINNSMMAHKVEKGSVTDLEPSFLPCAKVMGAAKNRKRPYRPASVINISAMSYGSLSAKALDAMNNGAKKVHAYHNTGEGGLSPYHKRGADVVFHFGTGYFGVRDDEGNFSMEKLKKLVEENPQIRAIEVKLSQGAKPGKGGVLPGSKITKEISEIRHVPMGEDVLSPPTHSAFQGVKGLVDFVEQIATETGLPTGIKAAIGKLEQWEELAEIMKTTGKGPDFITVDGGEGGTGAAPPSFADHVSLPWVFGFSDLYQVFQQRDLTSDIVFIASGKLGFPAKAAMAFSMGADCINVAREAMISIGCIQAKACHNNTCPTGIATQNQWLQRGIVVPEKAERLASYFKKFNKELLEITHAAGYEHPCQFDMRDVDVSTGDTNMTQTLEYTYKYQKTPVDFKGMKALKECEHLGGSRH
ncbi:FMN-binding glutamate synthase family protein [Nonlabens agnitus]|uniref:FMN-binding glutamate synthase family protein n=1 Tax=Nonlabens agnitus TaxID=870484 RepID=A0A2S9WRB5_9FLAO|nr:FMN-binding glutamate synthase family protein [Nonlabens agnitus]PRP66011.1 FMN-binding glutamate synthase family protein [Nonlabens agnitus]